ncbi:MAG: hypothetical protein JNL60_04075 [Bacteroidia bacterium]|nr:hypothetical protein [Bacteroidia bacterium]
MLCFLGVSIPAQVFYTTNPKYLSVKTEQNNLISRFNYFYPDTMVTDLVNYFPRNFLGNTGLPSPQYILKYGSDPIGFRLMNPPLENDQFRDQQVEYYRTKGPYADLTGIAGSKEYQAFKCLFTHTYRDKVNIAVRFNRYTSKGFYQKQKTYTNNFFLSSNYSTRNNRFGYFLYALNNGNKNSENGGLRDGALNDSTMRLTKEILPVNLSNASSSTASRDNREIRAMINPWIRLNKKTDSTTLGSHYIQLKSKASFLSYRYKDPGVARDSFYNAIYLDTVQTNDSSHVFQMRNELDYSWISRANNFGFSVGYVNELNKTHQFFDSVFMNHIVRADFVSRKDFKSKDTTDKTVRSFQNTFKAEYVVEGPNAGNYKIENNASLIFNPVKKRLAYFNILYEKRNADYIYNNWVSNHFYWFNNGLGPQRQLQANVGLKFGRIIDLSLFTQTIDNYLYFDSLAMPAQYKQTITKLGAKVGFLKIFFKHLGVGLSYIYQRTNHLDVVRMPSKIATAKLFYHGNLFKNNLQLQIGTQLQVYDEFYSYAYMPATEIFYIQNGFRTDAYPYLDIYLQARIRPVSFFIKLENALFGFAGPNYAITKGYYQTDRAFRFGINWVFFD